MSQEFKYQVYTYVLPTQRHNFEHELETMYNEGWVPTNNGLVYVTYNGGKEVLAIATLAKENPHEHPEETRNTLP